MMRFLVVLALLLPASALAQSNIAFPPEVYAGRRARLAEAMGDGVAIVPGRHLIRRTSRGPIKQDPAFWYLTGVETVYGVAVISGSGTELFLPEEFQFAGGQYPMAERDRFRHAKWNLPGPWRLHAGDEAIAGVDEIYPVDTLGERLEGLVAKADVVYLPLERRSLYAPPGFDPPKGVYAQMVDAIRSKLGAKKIEDLTPLVDRMRLIKDDHEIAALRRAAAISGDELIEAMRRMKPGMTTLEIAGIMEAVWKREGSPRAAFATIVRTGPQMTFFTLANEQYDATRRVIGESDLVFIDDGAAEYKMYTSDLCRTIPASGKFTAEQRKYYDIVNEAREAAIAAVKPDAMLLDAVKAAARVFQSHGLEQYEDVEAMGEDKVWGLLPSPTNYLTRDAGMVRGIRALGHFIGLEVADPADYTRPLEPGMVFTVEPKIYIPEKGITIMIEDMVLVTETGHENLSPHAPTDPDAIERLMASSR